jgi:hypothetical protein
MNIEANLFSTINRIPNLQQDVEGFMFPGGKIVGRGKNL